jgi:4-diphosphocytidyl-2-C-methyl-D-erythritol kinase
MEEIAYAKINLALRVRGRRADGFHDIDTLFAFAEDGDVLSVTEGEGVSLRVTGPFGRDLGPAADNLVLRAAALLDGGKGAALTLDKRLPLASGIGGGSADAAAALRLLVRWWRLPLGEADLLHLARQLGADVPACFLSRPARGTGRGDVLMPVEPGLAGAPLLLVNPRVPVSTAEVYRRWQGVEAGGNDLEPPAREVAPVISKVLDSLHGQNGTTLVRMSGSGATCFALFESNAARDAAAAAIAGAHRDWWRLATRLR